MQTTKQTNEWKAKNARDTNGSAKIVHTTASLSATAEAAGRFLPNLYNGGSDKSSSDCEAEAGKLEEAESDNDDGEHEENDTTAAAAEREEGVHVGWLAKNGTGGDAEEACWE